jgi:streptogramin lyase
MEKRRNSPKPHSGQLARRRRRAHPPTVLTCAVVAALAFVGGSAAGAPSSGALALVKGGRLIATLPLRAEPMRVSYGDGAFWVVAPHQNLVVRVGPTRRLIERHSVADEPYDAVWGAGVLWVARHDGFDVVGLPGRRSRSLETPQLAIAYAFGSVWTVGADGVLYRLDPRRLRVTGSVDGVASSNEGFEPKIAASLDSLWISDAVRRVVTRVDPRRLRIVGSIPHGGNGVAVAGRTVWSTDASNTWRVAGGAPLRLRTGTGPYDVAAGGDSVWVANRFSRTVSRVDPRRARVTKTIRVPGRAAAIAYGGGYVAVALF